MALCTDARRVRDFARPAAVELGQAELCLIHVIELEFGRVPDVAVERALKSTVGLRQSLTLFQATPGLCERDPAYSRACHV